MTKSNEMSCCGTGNINDLFETLDLRILIDPSKCSACGLCEEICPFGLPEKGGDGVYEINKTEECIECSACQRNCPDSAIIMEEQKGCGCLWDARDKAKELNANNSCC